jgi:putative spermidine/putrescine transport system permease protein
MKNTPWKIALCFAPGVSFFTAFWLLPMALLIALPAQKGVQTYWAILTDARYFNSLLNTVLLSSSVTLFTLFLGAAVGIYLARTAFKGRELLVSLLTLPLSFPGVIIGFFVILFGGRQGIIPSWTEALGVGKLTFAYSLVGLFIAYVYFSLPRTIANYYAAVKEIEMAQEDAARSLGASQWQVARDVWFSELLPTTYACGAIVFATAMGAFGTAFTLASRFEVLPITIYDEFTNYANFALAASLSIALGLVTWLVLAASRILAGRSNADHALGL